VDFEDFDDTDMSTFDTFETMFGKLFDNGAVVADALTRIARVRSKLKSFLLISVKLCTTRAVSLCTATCANWIIRF